MPVYDYKCPNCKWKGELFNVAYSENGAQACPECDEPLGSPTPAFKMGSEPYQMKAVMNDGSHVKGHFGKEAKRDQGGRKKR